MAFGSSKARIEDLEQENGALRSQVTSLQQQLTVLRSENETNKQWVAYLKGLEPMQLAQQVEAYRQRLAAMELQIEQAQQRLAGVEQRVTEAKREIVETQDAALLQEVGIYEYRHPLQDAVAYKARLQEVRDSTKAMIKGGRAVTAASDWTVNNSRQQGERMVRELSKLMLRAYNSEADTIVRTLKAFALKQAIVRLDKARETIAKLGQTMQIRISDEYHRARVLELELTADYLVKVEEERERQREERERQREEEKARREFEAEKARLGKEQTHYQKALEKLREKGDEAGVAELAAKLEEIEAAIHGVEEREANIRAGYVYAISNFGSFGEHMVKIGLTRRIDPLDRVRELGDASVPFNFDVHAIVFSHDAVGLENALHQAFVDRRVNMVNQRREFFYASPVEVREALQSLGGQQLLEFHEVPDATDWRASGGEERLRELLGLTPGASVPADAPRAAH